MWVVEPVEPMERAYPHCDIGAVDPKRCFEPKVTRGLYGLPHRVVSAAREEDPEEPGISCSHVNEDVATLGAVFETHLFKPPMGASRNTPNSYLPPTRAWDSETVDGGTWLCGYLAHLLAPFHQGTRGRSGL